MSTLPPCCNSKFPVIGSPLFIISNPKLVIAQCKAGVVGSMPALNARPAEQLDEWLAEITEALAAWDKAHPEQPAAPFAINQIVHKSNDRLEHDMHVRQVQGAHRHHQPGRARGREPGRARLGRRGAARHHQQPLCPQGDREGADGLIAVAAGAGGHAGTKSPFALVQEIREWFDGPLALSGAIANGGPSWRRRPWGRLCLHRLGLHRHRGGARRRRLQAGHRRRQLRRHRLQQPVHRRARQLPGPFDPCRRAGPGQAAGERPQQDELWRRRAAKAWKDIWGSGQGIGAIKAVVPAAELIARLRREYDAARRRLLG
jgi:nitronate monooxygenase